MKNLTKIFTLALLLFLSVSADAQGKGKGKATKTGLTAQQIAESGSIEGNVYKNKFLGFSITIPQDWVLISEDANRALPEVGRQMSATKPENEKQNIISSISNTRVLFMVLPFAPGDGRNAASIACGVEKVPGFLLKTYAEQNKRFVLETKRLKKDLYPQIIGGVRFNGFEVEGESNGVSFDQIYLVASRKGVAFFFVLTFSGDTYRKTALDTLKTLTFERQKP